MDRYGATFGAYDDAEPGGGDAVDSFEDSAPHAPPSPVGQDERRMQVRAYNHWAALLGDAQFPDIAELSPENLDDFGPYGVLLDFSGKRGIDDPAIRFLGEKLAEECGGDTRFKRLSEVPGRSLLSRITDHYLQILANKAPIGFEAEFTNDRGASVLYRGILLPWSSDGEAIDFIFGVINWKEMADASTADALLAAIDASLAAPAEPQTGHQGDDIMDRMPDLSGYQQDDDAEAGIHLPMPTFGAPPAGEADVSNYDAAPLEFDEALETESEDEDDDAAWAGFSGLGEEDPVYAVDYGEQGLEDGEYEDDVDGVVDPLADGTESLGLASLVSRSGRVKQSVDLSGMAPLPIPRAYEPEPELEPVAKLPVDGDGGGDEAFAYQADDEPVSEAVTAHNGQHDDDSILELDAELHEVIAIDDEVMPSVLDLADVDDIFVADEPEISDRTAAPISLAAFGDENPEGLYDCLAAARELAQTARSSEDRGRKALYQAVGRAYDFSIEAAANPADFEELLIENGLTAQDRAPMTPIVKLVFGVDYDKTRLTEYATVLGYAHRTGVARGTLDRVLASAEGGLKGIVQAERQARKEADGRASDDDVGVRDSLARKLRRIEPLALDDLDPDGAEFALVMVRRLPSGELVVLGEVPDDVPFVEKAARKLLR